MTITTDMLLAAGCEIWNYEGGRRAYSHDNWLVAYEVGDEWQLINYRTIQEKYPVKPRFRVKARSVPMFQFSVSYEDWKRTLRPVGVSSQWALG